MPHYKYGKQKELTSFQEILKKVKNAQLAFEQRAYFWLLYYCGVRKSEGYERIAKDVKVTGQEHAGLFIIDFHQRKKNGEEVPPLELNRSWPGIEELVQVYKQARKKRALYKHIFYYENKQRKKRLVKANWLFPHIQSDTAWRIAKKVLGKKHYPHYLRLNRLTEIGTDEHATSVEMKSFSGIKDLKTLEDYLGISKKEQDKALSFMDKLITTANE